MSIISTNPTTIKNYESQNELDVDETATEILALREFVVLSYDIDKAKKEYIFHCRINLDYAVCSRCKKLSEDIHQYKCRCVRDVSCFQANVYLVFNIRRFRCPKCHKVFTESLESIITGEYRIQPTLYKTLRIFRSSVTRRNENGIPGMPGTDLPGCGKQA